MEIRGQRSEVRKGGSVEQPFVGTGGPDARNLKLYLFKPPVLWYDVACQKRALLFRSTYCVEVLNTAVDEIERSIIKKFKKSIWYRFMGSIIDYRLISVGDRIAVCVSGGKDSMLLAKCVQHLQKYSKYPFEAEYIAMDPGYAPKDRQLIIDNAERMGIPLRIFDTEVFRVVDKAGKSPCYLCARMRRGHLYRQARDLGCNKIALGHHFDDVIETILMSLLYGAEIRTMMPKLRSTNFPGMELIRPMYQVREADIVAWQRYNGLTFLQGACRVTAAQESGGCGGSKRSEMKALIASFRKINPYIDINIFKSVHNVSLETIIGYRRGNEYHSFLDSYDDPSAAHAADEN